MPRSTFRSSTTCRPIREKPTMPTVRRKFDRSPYPVTEPQPPYARCSSAARNGAFFPAKMIAARVYSATGTALASAALVTRIPRRHTSWPTRSRTLPAPCSTARSRGAAASRCGVRAGAPQDVSSTSARARRSRDRALSRSSVQQGSSRVTRPAEAAQPVPVEVCLEAGFAHHDQSAGLGLHAVRAPLPWGARSNSRCHPCFRRVPARRR